MNKEQFEKYKDIPAEKFAFASVEGRLHDQKLDTKPVGYFRDAFNRFKRNKASLVAAIIILLLVVYAIVGPWLVNGDFQQAYQSETVLVKYKELPPRLKFLTGLGFWDGSEVLEITENRYRMYQGIATETGYNPIVKVIDVFQSKDENGNSVTKYKVRVNKYYSNSAFKVTLTYDEYKALMDWQDEHQLQVILPYANNPVNNTTTTTMADIWYNCDQRGNAKLDANGNLVASYRVTGADEYTSSMRLEGDPYLDGDVDNAWRYAFRTGTAELGYNYEVRVGSYNYFVYKFGFEPSFAFGTNSNGYDIFSRLARGARFSFLLAIAVSVINLTIGAIYGAVEGYYGGAIDMVLERISDILSAVPFMVVTVLFQLHLADKVGVVGALIYAFVLTGWIGMASRVRMQFYRFKNQEYVLAARTLGASDRRIMWKHIFPNSLGTIITSCVLVIPGVIFSETSLSYLGIINLDSPTLSSVGSMLSAGQSVMTSAPHVVLFPALFIALLEISFNLFGNGLRDAFNPSLRGSEG